MLTLFPRPSGTSVARKGLKYAKLHHLIDHDNFLAYGVGLTFFTLGVVGLLGGDDLLACFIVGNSVSWDDFYRLETEDEAFQVGCGAANGPFSQADVLPHSRRTSSTPS